LPAETDPLAVAGKLLMVCLIAGNCHCKEPTALVLDGCLKIVEVGSYRMPITNGAGRFFREAMYYWSNVIESVTEI
jgi:hypothetical protein